MSEEESEKLMQLIEELTVIDGTATSVPNEPNQSSEKSDKVEG